MEEATNYSNRLEIVNLNMDNLLERILLELERLIQGNEGNMLIFSLVIMAISLQYLYLVKSYVDPYEKAKKRTETRRTKKSISFISCLCKKMKKKKLLIV